MMLDDRTRALLARSERRVSGRAANEEIERERVRHYIQHGRCMSYEVVLEANHGFTYLATVVAAKLAYCLVQKKMSAYACNGVFVSIWVGDELYFIDARDFFDAVREAEGLDAAGWRLRVRSWELT